MFWKKKLVKLGGSLSLALPKDWLNKFDFPVLEVKVSELKDKLLMEAVKPKNNK